MVCTKEEVGFFVADGCLFACFLRAGALRRAEGAAAALVVLAAFGIGSAVGFVEGRGRLDLAQKGLPIDRGSLLLLA